jgi:D-xylono/L-arabinono-1,4-lactonase
MKYQIEEIVADNNLCGEAPTWDYRNNRLLWVDNEASTVCQYVPANGERTVISRDLQACGIAINEDRRLIFAGFGGLHVWQAQNIYDTVVANYEGGPLQFNDIIADAKGRIYGGTIYWGASGMEQYGRLYLIARGGEIAVVDEGIEVSNGLGFSTDDRILYYSDSTARKIYAYDVDQDSGELRNKRVFVNVPAEEGIPDGLTVDAQGFVWSAQWYGSQIVRYDPDGKVERQIVMPVKQVSSVMFGGKDLSELYVTSAGNSWRSDFAPPGYDFEGNIGGSLYRIKLDIQGRREHLAGF